jgi:predicted ABC-type transport system involved in lysophospholipase L1 biosynthesis ATPase subunit
MSLFSPAAAPSTPAFTPGAPLLSIRNVEKSYDVGSGKSYVLRRITTEVKQGEFATIMGPSGRGKSTLLAILGMLDHTWAGEYDFGGLPVHRMSLKERNAIGKRYIGFVFQQYHLLDDLTVAENLDIPLSYRDVKKSERQAIVADVLDRFHIVGKKDLYPAPALRRPAAAGGRRARRDRQARAPPRRRAHRQPPLRAGARDHGAVQGAQPGGHHGHPGHALRGERQLRRPRDQSQGRLAGDRQQLAARL